MKGTFTIGNSLKTVDLSKPIDISIPLQDSSKNPLAWYLEKPSITPVQVDDWVGKVSEGASVNFNNIRFNPHAHGTHTECVGHISEAFHSVNRALTTFFFTAEVLSVTPEKDGADLVISLPQVKRLLQDKKPEAVVIRTLPNLPQKKSRKYSHSNWPYLHEDAARFLREIGVSHLLIDLPSVDKEKDDGKLLAHKAFWNYPKAPRLSATITEFVYVPNRVKDGSYLLNLQMASFCNDAAPSKPVLYKFL
ncbi:cyclase family protein [Rasiella rasia]|uniref:Cyclase family protein n=1 Tax=Rasiella rasia TaxID=2744027 RepID=A0A6G6GLU3_9FLAO|nr:cyclase family protein [Rasiella rasia]QIE59460.1 cyclase family protein [Rasiella rasia]